MTVANAQTSSERTSFVAFASTLKISSNRDLNRLAVHTTLHQLAWTITALLSAVFLLQRGLAPAAIFASFALIIGLRLFFRGLVLMSVMRIGLRRTFILGTLLFGVQSPLLAIVHGPGIGLLVFCTMSALAQAFYWTCYQTTFAAVGEVDSRGNQVGWRQVLIAVAGIVGPAAGGLMLEHLGAWAAFGTAAAIELGAIVPLLRLQETPIARLTPKHAYPAAHRGFLLLATDGWIFNSATWIWSIVMFQALGSRYDAFGGGIAAASLAGALGGFVLGNFIDIGHGHRATRLSTCMLAITLVMRAFCGSNPLVVMAVAIGTALFGGIYVTSLMTSVYNEAKRSPCIFRFQFVAEAGWDTGGGMACVLAGALCAAGIPLQPIILLALPMVALQSWLLLGSYAQRSADPALLPFRASAWPGSVTAAVARCCGGERPEWVAVRSERRRGARAVAAR